MRIGQKYITGTFAADQWVKIYESILSSAITSITISSLDGDTDEEYLLIYKFINGYNGTSNFVLRVNNETTNANRGYQCIIGSEIYINSYRSISTEYYIGYGTALNNVSIGKDIIFAKSGYLRTAITEYVPDIFGTTLYGIQIIAQVWSNTADNITSLVITERDAHLNALGVGTSIELYKKKYKS